MSIFSSEEYKDGNSEKKVSNIIENKCGSYIMFKGNIKKCNVSYIEIKQLEVINYEYFKYCFFLSISLF